MLMSRPYNNIKMIISNTPLIHQSGFSSLVSFPNPLGTKIKSKWVGETDHL